MFCCLFKKVTVHKTETICKIHSNDSASLIAVGGSNGFAKIIQIDVTKQLAENQKHPITFSQNLVCHKKNIILVSWNERYEKLSTTDDEGVIIVWKVSDQGMWETEMINNRDISHVNDLKWSKDGNFLCFVYEDGHAIVGTVDGQRCWGNDIKSNLYCLEWSPDSSLLLFAAERSNIVVFSSSGYQIGEIELPSRLVNEKIANISWWVHKSNEMTNNKTDKHLMICFTNGTILLLDDHLDLEPIEFSTDFHHVNCVEWNPIGDVIALTGVNKGNQAYYLKLFSKEGECLKEIKMQNSITGFSWDSYGTKLALITEGIILFSLVKQNYKWCFFSDTLVYSHLTEADHHSMVFWDTKNNIKNVKYVKNLLSVVACDSYCLLSAKVNDSSYIGILCNSIGSPVDNRLLTIKPKFTAINDCMTFIANDSYVYIWQFRRKDLNEELSKENTINPYGRYFSNSTVDTNLLKKTMLKEIMFFIEDIPDGDLTYDIETFSIERTAKDPIVDIFANNKFLLVTLASGKSYKYDLNKIGAPQTFKFNCDPLKVGLSPDGLTVWVIDRNHFLNVYTTSSDSGRELRLGDSVLEKKDVWQVIWSKEENDQFTFMEKNKLNIYQKMELSEMLECNGYIADFSNLEIKAVMLDDLMMKPQSSDLSLNKILVNIETRTLRDLREMINNNISMEELFEYTSSGKHNKLWRIFTEHAMLKLDFAMAEKSMIHYDDFLGLNFIKRVKKIENNDLKKAEIYSFYNEYDKAEEVYMRMNRIDLAIELRKNLGHWEKVIELLSGSQMSQDQELKVAYNAMGNQLLEQKDLVGTETLFEKTKNYEGLIEVWFKQEEYEKAAAFIENIPDKSEFLLFMGEKFETYGLVQEAAQCYSKYGDIKKAIDHCVQMNKWDLAVDLAEKHNFQQIDGLINKFAKVLFEKNRKMDLVELYRRAHRHTDAAKMIIKIAEDLKALNAAPKILKKLYVIAALEVESFKSRMINTQISSITQKETTINKTLDTLITSDLNNVSDKAINNPWRGAEAYHFYMLVQDQLYKEDYNSAIKTALRLVQYEKELETKEVYRLIALSAFLNKSYKECSKALSKLENLDSLTEDEKENYRDLSVSIFTQFKPNNQNEEVLKCPGKNCKAEVTEFDIDCKECGITFSPCVITGTSIVEREYVKCKQCKHKSLRNAAKKDVARICRLCHANLTL